MPNTGNFQCTANYIERQIILLIPFLTMPLLVRINALLILQFMESFQCPAKQNLQSRDYSPEAN